MVLRYDCQGDGQFLTEAVDDRTGGAVEEEGALNHQADRLGEHLAREELDDLLRVIRDQHLRVVVEEGHRLVVEVEAVEVRIDEKVVLVERVLDPQQLDDGVPGQSEEVEVLGGDLDHDERDGDEGADVLARERDRDLRVFGADHEHGRYEGLLDAVAEDADVRDLTQGRVAQLREANHQHVADAEGRRLVLRQELVDVGVLQVDLRVQVLVRADWAHDHALGGDHGHIVEVARDGQRVGAVRDHELLEHKNVVFVRDVKALDRIPVLDRGK